ncbi:hypothetical protein LR392_04755 [Arthrobacter sp. AK04]|uniref:hypothetical protein n=1 Tax=Arthrobacter sp. AK04 TaxID=2900048 RepID=UPI001E5E931C|nr:hypothetical protein [Arthrobacter sp. AK04]MCD5341537.1 hypothetical protein [Arthrobacter sp. AK04]
MPDHDQEGPFDRAQPLDPSRLQQPKDKSVQSEPNEPRKPDAAESCEQDMSQVPTRWQRFKEHPAFKTGLAVGALAAVGGVTFLTLRSPEAFKQVSTALLEKVPEFTEAAFEGMGDEVIRKSPTEHSVSGHQRLQHYGPGRTESKIVQVSSYSRGCSA